MNEEELNEAVQHSLQSYDILTPRERADQAMVLIGRQVAAEIGGLAGTVVRGTTSLMYRPQPKKPWWRFW